MTLKKEKKSKKFSGDFGEFGTHYWIFYRKWHWICSRVISSAIALKSVSIAKILKNHLVIELTIENDHTSDFCEIWEISSEIMLRSVSIAKILQHQLTTGLTVQNDHAPDFWEIPPAITLTFVSIAKILKNWLSTVLTIKIDNTSDFWEIQIALATMSMFVYIATWHDSFIFVIWLIHMCDMTHS